MNKDNKLPYVLIIGSGLHKEAFGKGINNNLTSWENLLQSIGCRISETSNYILDFEMYLAQKTGKQNEKAANEIEKKLLKQVSTLIKKEQEKAVGNCELKYPMEIFNPHKVSDVISLNFDLVPEYFLSKGKPSRVKYCKQMVNENGKTSQKNISNTRHRVIGSKDNGSITFWHPHGDIDTPSSLQLGIRKYGTSIDQVELLRKRFKQNEPNSKHKTKNYVESWYDKLMKQPVIIIGASLSDNEWDLWYALVNKMRNFAKKSNKQFESKIYKMNCVPHCNIIHKDIFTEIILDSTDCEAQWQTIKNILK